MDRRHDMDAIASMREAVDALERTAVFLERGKYPRRDIEVFTVMAARCRRAADALEDDQRSGSIITTGRT